MSSNKLKAFQSEFLDLALEYRVLSFGAFKLKSGRISPYFFNLGRISSGSGLRRLAHAYAEALEASGIEFDVLFGPAYKGIPLAAAISAACAERGHDIKFCYNRKEAKDHGEGGMLVGADVRGRRVVIVDDVLTAGTAMRQSIELLRRAGAELVAALVALDRQERGSTGKSALTELAHDEGMTVHSLVNVNEILEYLGAAGGNDESRLAAVESILSYQARYGVSGRDPV